MAAASSLLLPREMGIHGKYGYNCPSKGMFDKSQIHSSTSFLSSHFSRQDFWSVHLLNCVRPLCLSPVYSRHNIFLCQSILKPTGGFDVSVLKTAASILTSSFNALHGSPLVHKLVPAVGVIAFAAWGLSPLIRFGWILFLHKSDTNWKNSNTHYVVTSYLQPLLLWAGATLICRTLDPVILPSVRVQAVKQRLLTFIQSLSTVLSFAYCLSSLIQQTHKFFGETKDSSDARNMGFEFAGKAVYTAVWIAAVSLFMELLGFSTQKWLTAGGLGTVLLTLAGREIFTNFLSSVMIHATRPFVLNNWIQTKIGGYEVSGSVEHVGWWSPTVIRGDDREAIHIPNHKFTVNVVRNLTQKTHWRIKTHLAISHLDVNKINNIVADMRKVLAKNPQVEQQKLHRRVFLDNIDRENQALLIMVSCFVKTSHFEEYLRVKEVILLDLLRVISHHRARLATPIRTVQKIYKEADVDEVPLADSVMTVNRANHPFLLIEPSYKINNSSEDKTKAATPPRPNQEKDGKSEVQTTASKAVDASPPIVDGNRIDTRGSSGSSTDTEPGVATSELDGKMPNTGSVQSKNERQQVDKVVPGEVDAPSAVSQAKQDGERPTTPAPSQAVARPTLEENILLGVALEGSKRTLPIEEEMTPSPSPSPAAAAESKELAACRNGNSATTTTGGKDKKDDAGVQSSPSDLKE
ncbi:PREDICTED: mechanosensitive ion channel protein 3, chloroplastic-like [Ipomoea nil]|uniref:mechanosensitive ion channel protein 3, chloroplastic-like n=1 Tax=Ipomoea nil TaxID=35883 RepID=UPI000901B1A3|nr:PREDICTED: mechanosensitive ion channel protein 3, chloroplastic-like [Ipomoea nil]XP_019182338.1 PREDICTED: mechanosensitive ion channel protein 3, chloroplastic-like [Ipomoea nil]XP_019182339.1 PREDICTED: mechanosensitive ion channel protein 3, chloroplastic-like [Ipomoea nil]XP_019182340.1 PREDICTED: mechanosensitive ion channel protein 3, chloroplastic-like [Ipomoea nil]XP_019182341.1 PREDICTED: mechanosensitive ion channel protein 3, chloroplastic-like [Ipomoea nil]